MSNLVENILIGNHVEAGKLFKSHMESIVEKKLYEKKRMMQSEAFGMLKFSRAEIEDKKKAGFKKATDVLGDPSKIKMKPLTKLKKKKTVKEETLDEIKLSGEVGGTISRKLTAGGIKLARKYLGRDFSKRYMSARKPKSGSDEWDTKAAGAEPSHTQPTQPSKSTRNGIIRRNINTLMGREPGYKPEPKTPEQKGGRLGKAVRDAGKTWGNVLSKGMSGPLEE